jgi:soluble lytic murein transglycosylase-like protein
VPDLRDYALGAAKRNGVPMDLFERQIGQESKFDPKAFNSRSGATGIAQIIKRWHPGVDPTDPIASLDYAAKWMADLHRIYGSWARALAAFNWGPANVANWDGQRATLPEETRHYLDVILGDGWPEPAKNLTAETPQPLAALRVSEDGVRLRQGPGTDSAILATLRHLWENKALYGGE